MSVRLTFLLTLAILLDVRRRSDGFFSFLIRELVGAATNAISRFRSVPMLGAVSAVSGILIWRILVLG